jgi:hypothetical protein
LIVVIGLLTPLQRRKAFHRENHLNVAWKKTATQTCQGITTIERAKWESFSRARFQPAILKVEQSGLLTHIASMESVS